MIDEFPMFKATIENEFKVIDDKNILYSRFYNKYFYLKEFKFENHPDSFIFNDFEILGLYHKDTTISYAFYFLTNINNDYYGFRFDYIDNVLSYTRTYFKNENDEREQYDQNIVFEFIKYKDYICNQIVNSPQERLINILQRGNQNGE